MNGYYLTKDQIADLHSLIRLATERLDLNLNLSIDRLMTRFPLARAEIKNVESSLAIAREYILIADSVITNIISPKLPPKKQPHLRLVSSESMETCKNGQ